MNKLELRKIYLGKRAEFNGRKEADEKIFQKLVDACSNFSSVFTYINFKDEVNTTCFIKNMLDNGKRIFVPVCNTENCTMQAVEISSLNDLKPNKYGILEPETEFFVNKIKFDAVIFPGAVFDINGNRIGYGKGYYDKFISSLEYTTKKIGICYDFQLLHSIPNDKHDIKMDSIITDTRTVNII